jgi:hypothetical protein
MLLLSTGRGAMRYLLEHTLDSYLKIWWHDASLFCLM